jgi:integrase
MVDVRAANPDGSRVRDRRVLGGTKLQARAWGVERERELIEGRGKPVRTASVTFHKFLAEWWPTYKAKGYRPSAIRFVEKYLRVHLVPHFGDVPLDKIDRQALDKFVATLFAKPGRWSSQAEPTNLSSTSVQHAMDVLHTVLVAAEDWKLLDKLPKFPTVKRDARGLSLDFYDVSETERLLVGARDEHDRLLLLFALHTGARAGEQIAVTWPDIDLHAKRVDLRRSRVEGVTHESTKNRKGRSVPLSDPLVKALKAARHRRGPLVFCVADGSPLTPTHLRRALGHAARAAGLRLLRWHDLRHSFASNLTKAGTPLKQVQDWLGHSTITMTMRYAHLAPHGGREHLAGLTSATTNNSQTR